MSGAFEPKPCNEICDGEYLRVIGYPLLERQLEAFAFAALRL
jgi:hypothetical protein